MSAADARANRLGALALALADRLAAEAERAVGASPGAAAALAVIAQQPGATIEDLRRAVDRSHPASVRIVDRLAGLGLVERRQSGRGRAVALHATAEGRRRVRAYLRGREALLGDLVAGLPAGALDALLARALTGLAELPAGVTVCRLCDKGPCRGRDCPVVARLEAQGLAIPPPATP